VLFVNVLSKVGKLLILILSTNHLFSKLDYHSRACAGCELFSVLPIECFMKMFGKKMLRDKSSEVLHTKLHLQPSNEVKHGFPCPTMSAWDM
jgi:hypothetical protein